MPRVYEYGYQLVADRSDPDDRLIAENFRPSFRDAPRLPYDEYRGVVLPPGHYRRFSKLRSDSSILRFANAYGFLGVETRPWSLRGRLRGEPLEAWRAAIAKMRRAIELLQVTRQARSGRLTQLIHWVPGEMGLESGSQPYYYAEYRDAITGYQETILHPVDLHDGQTPPQVLWWMEYPYLVKPARFLLCKWVNEEIAVRVHTCLELNTTTNLVEFHNVCETLLSELWLQFAQEMLGRHSDPSPAKHQADCLICGNKFLATRSTARYCGRSACKQKAYRMRKRAMHHAPS